MLSANDMPMSDIESLQSTIECTGEARTYDPHVEQKYRVALLPESPVYDHSAGLPSISNLEASTTRLPEALCGQMGCACSWYHVPAQERVSGGTYVAPDWRRHGTQSRRSAVYVAHCAGDVRHNAFGTSLGTVTLMAPQLHWPDRDMLVSIWLWG